MQEGRLRRNPTRWLEVATADYDAAMREDGAANWDQPERRLAGMLVCDNPACRDPAACSRLAVGFRLQVAECEYEQDDTYRVRAVDPPPVAFVIHEAVRRR